MASQLADYQGLAHRLCITPKTLQEMILDPKDTHTIVIIQHETIIGFAMYTILKNNRLYHHGYAMYIDELYVIPKMRGNGLGTAVFKYIAQQAVENGCNRLEWWVTEGNDSAVKFYESLGARALNEFTTFRLLQPELGQFATSN
jgi:GNAT superfamily N-acetyltransferase